MRKTAFIIISLIIVFLLAIAVYSIYRPGPEKQEAITEDSKAPESITSLPETVPETTSADILSTTSDTTAEETAQITPEETAQATAQDTSENLPTLRLVVYEGPVAVQDSDMCYYRIKAIVTGKPYPAINFSKDDSNGAWGKNIAQVNLKNNESYNLVVTATNSAGTVTKSVELTWNQ